MTNADDVYKKLAQVLDTLPNGFPAAEDGLELTILKWIFEPAEAELFCELRLEYETAAQIAERTGRPLEGLEEQLIRMGDRGEIYAIPFGDIWVFKMAPWVFGIYEFQNRRMNAEFVELAERYQPYFARPFFSCHPQLMQVLPVEQSVKVNQVALTYATVSNLIEKNHSFMVNECVCKHEKALMGEPCTRPTEVCLAIAPLPGIFDNSTKGRVLTREQAYELLQQTEAAGLVHMTSNVQNGQIYICSCCKCCCGVLRTITELDLPAWDVVNSPNYAAIDATACSGCGLCASERCQVDAIVEEAGVFKIVPEKCIGCGLCITTCPTDAISLVPKASDKTQTPPASENDWFEARAQQRGVDYSRFK